MVYGNSETGCTDMIPYRRRQEMKYALLVGIDKYAYSQWNLNGCKNDVLDMYHLLVDTYKFPQDNVRVVVDERATKQGILDRLEWLVRQGESGSVIVFYYSGHGTRIRDRDGDEDLFDYMDECLVPHDAYPDNFLLDDEIAELLAKLHPEASAYILFDCCNSGTATRSIVPTPELVGAAMIPDGVVISEQDSAIRYVDPPIDIALRSYGRFLPIKKFWDYLVSFVSSNRSDKNVTIDAELNHLFMSASKDEEVSLEVNIGGKRRGVFTYYLCKLLRESPYRIPKLLHDDLLKKVRMAGFAQTPQLEMEKKFEAFPLFSPVVVSSSSSSSNSDKSKEE